MKSIIMSRLDVPGTGTSQRHGRHQARPFWMALALAGCLGLQAGAANPTPVQYFHVPVPEDHILTALQSIANGTGTDPVNPVWTYVSIAVLADSTIVYYDHYENGFDADISNPANLYGAGNPGGTQIWGDGNPANGAPPGFPSDLLSAGTVIILSNAVTTTTRNTVIDFDGGDKIASSKSVSVTRCGWATGPNTLLAGANEVFDTTHWGTDFRVPVGVDMPDSVDYQIFQYTGLSIMAGEGGATVQIDADANGTFETTVTLNQGAARLVNGNVEVGARILANRPVQVDLITGDINENYECDFFRLVPTALWSDSYYCPVSTPSSAQGVSGTGTTVCCTTPPPVPSPSVTSPGRVPAATRSRPTA